MAKLRIAFIIAVTMTAASLYGAAQPSAPKTTPERIKETKLSCKPAITSDHASLANH